MTPKQWIEQTGAIGLVSKADRYGGTYAHKDIAFEFAAWISVEFKIYLIKLFFYSYAGRRPCKLNKIKGKMRNFSKR